MKNRKLLFISDLDGTLLNRETKINPEGITLVNELINNENFIFTFATARDLVSVKKVIPDIQLKHPIITANGAFIIDPYTEKIIYGSYFTEKEAAELDSYIKEYGVHPIVYAHHQDRMPTVTWERNKETAGMAYYLQQRKNDPRLVALDENDRNKLMLGKVYCINIMDDKENLIELNKVLNDTQKYYTIFHQELYREEWWLSIYPLKTNKGKTAEILKTQVGATKVIVFGDETNDIPLFEIADEKYAVKNAAKKLKEIATKVIGTNEENGVPKWIMENYQNYLNK